MRLNHYFRQNLKNANHNFAINYDSPAENPKLSLGGNLEKDIIFCDDFLFPEKIMILVNLNPIFLNNDIKVFYKDKTLNLYEKNLYIKSLECKFIASFYYSNGDNFPSERLVVKKGETCYEKKFVFQYHDLKIENTNQVLAYGGIYKHFSNLDEIEQSFFRLSNDNSLSITKVKTWLNKGVSLYGSQKIGKDNFDFINQMPDHLSFSDAIESGDLKIKFFSDDDEFGIKCFGYYKSVKINKPHAFSNRAEIILIKE
jgi:hypothetical protein